MTKSPATAGLFKFACELTAPYALMRLELFEFKNDKSIFLGAKVGLVGVWGRSGFIFVSIVPSKAFSAV